MDQSDAGSAGMFSRWTNTFEEVDKFWDFFVVVNHIDGEGSASAARTRVGSRLEQQLRDANAVLSAGKV
eukprot:7194515-Pyramimonas_sp.AAC.2